MGYYKLVILVIFLSTIFLVDGCSREPVGISNVKLTSGDSPYDAFVDAEIVGNMLRVKSELGKVSIESGVAKIISMDKTVNNVEYRISLVNYPDLITPIPTDLYEIKGDKEWAGTLNIGEMKTFTSEIELKKDGLYVINIGGEIPFINYLPTGPYCCGIYRNIYLLYKKGKLTMRSSDGQWCYGNYYLNIDTLKCTPRGHPLAQRIENTGISTILPTTIPPPDLYPYTG